MDICSLPSLNISPTELLTDVGVAVMALHLVARAAVIVTRTPAPGSRWARAYDAIEKLALEVGYAKDVGLIKQAPTRYEELLKQAGQLLDHVSPEDATRSRAAAPVPPAAAAVGS